MRSSSVSTSKLGALPRNLKVLGYFASMYAKPKKIKAPIIWLKISASIGKFKPLLANAPIEQALETEEDLINEDYYEEI